MPCTFVWVDGEQAMPAQQEKAHVEESEASVCVARGRDFTDLCLCRLQAGRLSGSRRLRYSVQLPNGIAVTFW